MDRLNLSALNSSGAAEGQYSLQTAAVLTALVSFLILFTISGNVLVIIAVLTSRALRAPQNLFLVSLATADILVVTLVVPFSLTNELMGFWPFGSGWCSIYLALDVLFCTSSISHLCAISLDRYWSVTQAVEYNLKRTPRRVKSIMMLIWLISAVVSSPPLLFKDPKADSALRPQCELNDETWYILSSSLASFFAPCLIMILVYVRIYQVAKSRARNMSEKKTSPDDSTQTENTQSKSTSLGTSEPCPGSPAGATGSLVSGVSVTGLPQSHRKPLKSSSPEAKGQITSRNPQSAAAKHLTDVRWTRELRKTGGRVRKRSAHVREKRFTFVLAVVIGVFVVCWFPFFFSYSLYGLCRQACRIPHTLFKFFFWIGYCNSSLNPVIYTIFNQDFRRAFHRILCGSSQKP